MNEIDQRVALPNARLTRPPGLLVYTLHAHERIIPSLSWCQVLKPFDGTAPRLHVYAYAPGHEGDEAYLWSRGIDLATVDGYAAAGQPDEDHHQTDTAIRRGVDNFEYGMRDYVFRDYGARVYALIDAGEWPPGTGTSDSTTGLAVVHLTTWTPPA